MTPPPPPPRIPPRIPPHTPAPSQHQVRPPNRSPAHTPDTTARELDALADLFLGPSSPQASSGQNGSETIAPAQRTCKLEGVLLGHLPVYAAAWPMQYARVRADLDRAPVLMIRLTADTLLVDLVGTPDCDETVEPLDARSAIASGAAQAGCCLFRVDEVDECQLWDLAMLDRYAILTGSNDAAVVSCYRSLKTLAQHALEHDQPLPSVHLVIMGSNRTQSMQIHQRIARASSAFLETKLSEPTIIERISPVKTRRLYHGPNHFSLETIAAMVRDASAGTNPGAHIHAQPDPSSGHVEPHTEEARASEMPQEIPLIQSCPTVNGRFDQSSNRSEADEAPPRSTGSISCLLSTLVGGLSPLVSRCPYEPGVELAADDAGKLHLLAGAFEHASMDLNCNPIEQLLVVRSWAQQHAALLGRAESRLSVPFHTSRSTPRLCIEMHAILDDMPRARSLAMTEIHVHVVVDSDPSQAHNGLRVISMQ